MVSLDLVLLDRGLVVRVGRQVPLVVVLVQDDLDGLLRDAFDMAAESVFTEVDFKPVLDRAPVLLLSVELREAVDLGCRGCHIGSGAHNLWSREPVERRVTCVDGGTRETRGRGSGNTRARANERELG